MEIPNFICGAASSKSSKSAKSSRMM
jgi:hypothetical protein